MRKSPLPPFACRHRLIVISVILIGLMIFGITVSSHSGEAGSTGEARTAAPLATGRVQASNRIPSLFNALMPVVTLSASMQDSPFPTVAVSSFDIDGDGKADPGDTIRYTTTITASGGSATNVHFSDTPDANTTLVGGSIVISPLAINDGTYETIGNMTLTSANLGADCAANSWRSVTCNDTLNGGSLTRFGDTQANAGNVVVNGTNAVTTAHGSVVLNTDGTFVYNPTAGYEGTDSFWYTLTNSTITPNLTDTAQVTINVGGSNGMVWFVNSAGGGAGTQTSPISLDGLRAINNGTGTNPASGDTIFVREGTHTLTATLTLLNNQKLIGQDATGAGITVPVLGGPALPTNNGSTGGNAYDSLNPTGTAASITAAGLNAITLGSGNTLAGFTIGNSAKALVGGAGGTTAIGNLSVAQVVINTNGQAIDINTTSGNFVNDSTFQGFTSVTSSGGTNSISLVAAAAGTLTGSLFLGNGALSGTSGSTFVIGSATASSGGAFSASYSGTITSQSGGGNVVNIKNKTGGSVTFSGAISANFASTGVKLDTNASSTFTFSGGMTFITGAGNAFDANNSGTVGITGTNTISTTTGTGLKLVSTNAEATNGITFNSIASTTTGQIADITTSTGTKTLGLVTQTTGTSTTTALNLSSAGTVNIGNASTLSTLKTTSTGAGLTINATTLNLSGLGLSVTTSGGGTGVNDTGGTVSITGGNLVISSGTGTGFNASSGGTVSLTGSNNTITSTTGTALNIKSTDIGASGLTFKSISSSGGSNNGIVLDTTGTNGGLTVTGDGTNTSVGGNSSGGTITGKSGADSSATQGSGIYLNSTKNVVLRRMTINGTNQNFGIRGISVTGFTLEYSTVSGTNGDSAALDEGSVNFDNLLGTAAITSCNIDGGYEDNLNVTNTSGTLNRLVVSGSTFGFNSTANGNNNITLESLNGGTTLNYTIQNSTIKGARADWLNAEPSSGGTMDAIINNNTFDNTGANLHPGAVANGNRILMQANGTYTFHIESNIIKGSFGAAIATNSLSATASMNGTIKSNTIGSAGTANSGSTSAGGISIQSTAGGDVTVLIDSNTITQYNNHAILFTLGDMQGNAPTINATVTSNTVNTPGNLLTNFNGFHLNNGSVSTDAFTTCMDIHDNNFSNSGSGVTPPNNDDVRLRQRQGTTVQLPGYSGPARDNVDLDVAEVVTYLRPAGSGGVKNNTFVTGAANSVTTGGGFVGGSSCTQPIAMYVPEGTNRRDYLASADGALQNSNNSLFAFFNQKTEITSVEELLTGSAEAANATLGKAETEKAEAPSISIKAEAKGEAFTLAHGSKGQTLTSCLSSFMSAIVETISPTAHAAPRAAAAPLPVPPVDVDLAPTLPAGKSIKVVFDVTVNGPKRYATYTTQGTVTATGGISVLTDDPDVNVAPPDPTVTNGDCTPSVAVINTNDSGAGSLRQAFNEVCDGGNITFQIPANDAGHVGGVNTISLTSAELAITGNVTITGPNTGANTDPIVITGNDARRIFNISGSVTVNISNLTVTHGSASGDGGAIRNNEGSKLTLTNVIVSNSTASGGGGGIANTCASAGPTLILIGSTVSGNTANGDIGGGGVYTECSGTTYIDSSTIDGNNATTTNVAGYGGGGISVNAGNQLRVSNSTISNNTAAKNGGGLYAASSTASQIMLINSTMSGNSTNGNGGGLYGRATMVSTTVTNNRADADNDSSGTGGGININSLTVSLLNTIVAGNFHGTGSTADDIAGGGSATGSYNLIGTGGSGGLTNGVSNNQVGVADAKLGTLASNGGKTKTHALNVNSPAFDAGTDLTTLSGNGGSITNAATTINVADASAIPDAVSFVIQLDSEQMIVTAKSGNQLTVTRGANSTTAASHTDGAAVNPAFDQRGSGFRRKVDSADSGTTQTVDIGALEAMPTISDIPDKNNGIEDVSITSYPFAVGDATIGLDSITTSVTSDPSGVVQSVTVNNASTATPDLAIQYAANKFGTATITVTANKTINGTVYSQSDSFNLTVTPRADTPTVTNASTFVNQQTTSGLVIDRSNVDGSEVTHFKITNIQNGTLYKNDGTTQIIAGSFITYAEGQAGLKFTPTTNSTTSGSFDVQGATDGSGSGLSASAATATITVNKYNSTTTITSDNPDPSLQGQNVTVNWTVTNQTGGGPTPTGNVTVTVSGGAETCTNTVASGGCTLALNTVGNPRVITATYAGDSAVNGSSDTEDHVVSACVNSYTVTTVNNSGAGSLRDAITNTCSGATITFDTTAGTGAFDPANGPYTIQLLSALPDISKDLTITGPAANQLSVVGKQTPGSEIRVFNITSGNTVNISGMTISGGGNLLTGGGGINNAGTLTLTEVTVKNNTTTGSGGGIQNSGSLTLVRSTVSNNVASLQGGGISNTSMLVVTNSTISTNTANVLGVGLGGGIYTNSVLTVSLQSATIVSNSADASGGGVYSAAGGVSMQNTIAANNTATASPDLAGTGFTSNDYNLIENSTVVIGGATTHNKTGVDPQLGALTDNGGPTYTHAPLGNASPIVDAGKGLALSVDQRNQPRKVDNLSVTDAAGGDSSDIGAYEAPAPPSAPDLDAASDSGTCLTCDTDNITNDNTPTFTIGGVVNGATVDLLKDSNVVASGTASGTSIQLTPSLAISDGTYSFTARQIVGGGTSFTSTGLNVTIDTVAPTINIGAPSQSSANAGTGSVTYTITYGGADAVSLVTGNVTLNTTNTASATVGVSGSGTVTRTVTLSSITGQGTLGISIASGTASDTAGNTASAAGPSTTFSVDAVVPTVTSITRASANPTSASTVDYTVTFSEAVTGVDATDFTFTTTGVTNASVSNITGTGNTRTVTVNTGTGDGTLRLDIADDDTIVDAAGNPIGGVGTNNFTTGEVYTVDKTAPSVTSIVRANTSPTLATSVDFTVTFSENVTGVDQGDFSLTTTGAISGTSITNVTGSNNVYTVTVGTGSNDGTIRLDFADNDSVVDQTSKPTGGTGTGNANFTTGEVYMIDKTAPTVTINQASTQVDPALNASGINFTVVFSEPVTGFDSTDVTFSGAGATTATVTGTGPTYNVEITGMNTSGLVTASINANAAQDAVGHDSAASTSTDNQVTFQLDQVSSYEVNSLANTDDGACTALGTGNGCTLREAINAANLDGGNETITFAPALTAGGSQTILLDGLGSLPDITDGLTITGPTNNGLTISGNGSGRIFTIASGQTVNISNLTIANGQESVGGGIYNLGDLTIKNSTFTGNKAIGPTAEGGAIDSEGGSLTIINTTISGNSSDADGGGLLNCGTSTARLINVTITGNRSDADDQSPGDGGGISQVSSNPITLINTIVAGNLKGTASPTADDIYVLGGSTINLAASKNNLVGDAATAGGISNGTLGNIVGNSGSGTISIATVLRTTLANNGGVTKTHMLVPSSPAINAGNDCVTITGAGSCIATALTTDQRGTGFARLASTHVDIGAVEANYVIAATAGTPQSATINTDFATQLKVTVTESGTPQNSMSVTFTAPNSGPSGTFAASSTVTTNSSGVATAPTFTANGIAGGPYNVTAALENSSFTVNFALTNNKASAQVSLSNLTQTYDGTPKSATVTTNPLGLSVSVTYDGSTTPPTNFKSGGYNVVATITDPNYQSSPAQGVLTINKASTTTTVTANNATFDGAPHGGTAVVTGAGGLNQNLPVTYTGRNGTTYGPTTIVPTNGGDYTASASFAGDNNHTGSNASQDYQIAKISQTITFGPLANKTLGDPDFTVSATSSTGSPVSFSATGNCSVSGNIVHLTGAGSCTITASQAGNANIAPAQSVQQAFNIAKGATATTLSSSANPSVTGQNVTFTAQVASTVPGFGIIPTGSVQFAIDNTNTGSPVALDANGKATFSTSTLTAGTHIITAGYSGDTNFNISQGTLSGGQVVNSLAAISITDVSLPEGDTGTTSFLFTVTLAEASNLQVKVDYAVADGTAKLSDNDYQNVGTTGTLTFAPGQTSKVIGILVNGDTKNEPNETFFINLSNPVNASITDNQGQGTIQNDDAPGVRFASNAYSFAEGASQGNIIVTRSGDTALALDVDYITSDQAGLTPCQTNNTGFASERCDYNTAAGTLRFAPGEAQKAIPLVIINDAYQEGAEQLTIKLSNPVGGSLGSVDTATITITDDDTQVATKNPIDDLDFFLFMQYADFLGRVPDAAGFQFWKNRMTNACPAGQTCDRIDTSFRFFQSDEFKERGYFVYLFYHATLGRRPIYSEWIMDVSKLNGPKTVAEQEAAKTAFITEFMSRQEFMGFYNGAQTGQTFVDALIQKSGVTPASRQQLIDNYQTVGRAKTLRAFIETPEVQAQYFDRAFVTMLYFGYLRRDAEQNGFSFWMQKLNQTNHDYRLLVGGFLNSDEYRFRFAFIPAP